MGEVEKQRRWCRMHDSVLQNTGGAWANELSASLSKAHEEHAIHDTSLIPRLSFSHISESYKSSARRVFILDYEGTLAAHRTHTGITLGSPQRVVQTLSDLLQDPANLVYVMSGRMPGEVEADFRTLRGLGMIAENGCFMREAGGENNEWIGFPDMTAMNQWKTEVKAILNYYLERMEGSYLEERHCSLFVRFEKCEDKEASSRMIGECADHVNGAFSKVRVRAIPVNQAILIEPLDWSKAVAAERLLVQLQQKRGSTDKHMPVDFLMVAGDDREDEAIFRWANALGKDKLVRHVFTVSVGKRNTQAQSTLTQGMTGLLTVLSKLAKVSAQELPMDYFNVKARD